MKKFIEKNTVNANNKKTTNVQKQNTAAQLYKVTPQRYYVRNVQQRKMKHKIEMKDNIYEKM